MKEFCYWETQFTFFPKVNRRKILLVTNDKGELKMKFDLTMMGCEAVGSYKELMEYAGGTNSEYKTARKEEKL